MKPETTVGQEVVDHADESTDDHDDHDDQDDGRERLVDQVIDECSCEELDEGFPCARCYIAERKTFTGRFAR